MPGSRDRYVAIAVTHVGERYSARGECRCHGTCPGWDCSGFASGDILEEAGGPFLCGNTDTLAALLKSSGRTCSRATARATKGAWAIRTKENSLKPNDGHIVISLGDGRTVEAHDTADGVYIGTFDGNRGFQVFGYPPGLTGFDKPPSPNPGPTTTKEAEAMGIEAKIVPGARAQTRGVWKGRLPLIGFVAQADGAYDAVGFNGARITNPPNSHNPHGATSAFGMSVYHLGTLKAPVGDTDVYDGAVVGIAGDGGTFAIRATPEYV